MVRILTCCAVLDVMSVIFWQHTMQMIGRMPCRDEIIAVCLSSAFHTTKAALPHIVGTEVGPHHQHRCRLLIGLWVPRFSSLHSTLT